MTPRGRVLWAVLGYLILLGLLMTSRPLWLDEVIQLTGTNGTSFSELIHHVAANTGGAPFGYIPPWLLIHALGTELWVVRLPSMLAGLGCFLVFLALCRKFLGSTWPVVLWIVCPLLLRYSLEARPYQQALLFVMLGLLAMLKLEERESWSWALVLAATMTAAAYSQPFALFAPFSYAAFRAWQLRRPRFAGLCGVAFITAGVAFLPWFLLTRRSWSEAIPTGSRIDISVLLTVLRELVGDGYPAALAAILLAAFATFKYRGAMAAAVVGGIGLVLMCDRAFGYFFAIRQMIYVLPFLLLLMADGFRRKPKVSVCLVMVFFVASVVKDYRYFTDRKEDWGRLSRDLMEYTESGCVAAPAGDLALYSQFVAIRGRGCGPSLADRVVVPVHPYGRPTHVGSMTLRETVQSGFAKVEIYEKR